MWAAGRLLAPGGWAAPQRTSWQASCVLTVHSVGRGWGWAVPGCALRAAYALDGRRLARAGAEMRHSTPPATLQPSSPLGPQASDGTPRCLRLSCCIRPLPAHTPLRSIYQPGTRCWHGCGQLRGDLESVDWGWAWSTLATSQVYGYRQLAVTLSAPTPHCRQPNRAPVIITARPGAANLAVTAGTAPPGTALRRRGGMSWGNNFDLFCTA